MRSTSQKRQALATLEVAIKGATEGQPSDCLIAITGAITVDSSPDLRTRLLQCLRETKCEGIVIDFLGVAYIDTSALAVLLEVFRAARTLNKKFELRGLRDRARYLFETTRLLRLFENTGLNTPESESRE